MPTWQGEKFMRVLPSLEQGLNDCVYVSGNAVTLKRMADMPALPFKTTAR
jgi:hypothetical protein